MFAVRPRLWQRQMVLGPTPEFCSLDDDIPPPDAVIVTRIRTICASAQLLHRREGGCAPPARTETNLGTGNSRSPRTAPVASTTRRPRID